MSSSIVVRYERRSSSEGSPPPATPTNKSISKSSEARRVSAQELLASDSEDEELVASEQVKPAAPVVDYLKRSDSMGSLGSMTSMYSAAGDKGDYDISGEVNVAIWLKDGQLFVKIVKARGLAAAKKGVTADPYIKTYLLPDRTKHTKRKTSIQRKTLNPVFNEILKVYYQLCSVCITISIDTVCMCVIKYTLFAFICYLCFVFMLQQNKLDRIEVDTRTLWLSVWDWDRFGRNQFLGEVRLSLSSLDLTDPTERWHSLQDKVHNYCMLSVVKIFCGFTLQVQIMLYVCSCTSLTCILLSSGGRYWK